MECGGQSESDFPLTPVFCTPKDSTEELKWKNEFTNQFVVTPARFKQNETKLEERCKKYSIVYVKPQLEDSVDTTNSRRRDLNKKGKAAMDKIRLDKMRTSKNQNNAQARRKHQKIRTSRESTAERNRRLAKDASSKIAPLQIRFVYASILQIL